MMKLHFWQLDLNTKKSFSANFEFSIFSGKIAKFRKIPDFPDFDWESELHFPGSFTVKFLITAIILFICKRISITCIPNCTKNISKLMWNPKKSAYDPTAYNTVYQTCLPYIVRPLITWKFSQIVLYMLTDLHYMKI